MQSMCHAVSFILFYFFFLRKEENNIQSVCKYTENVNVVWWITESEDTDEGDYIPWSK